MNYLEVMEARRDAATPGQWEVVREETYDHLNGPGEIFAVRPVEGGWEDDEADAEFIAASRTDMDLLLEFVRKVEHLHRPWANTKRYLRRCVTCDGTWPCATTQAIEELKGRGSE
jgi:hypothetical protein